MSFLAHNLMSFLKSWMKLIEFTLLDVCRKDEITSFFLFSRLLSVSFIILVFCQTWQRHKAFQSSLSTDLLDKVLIETRGSSRVSWCSSSREREERESYERSLVRRFCPLSSFSFSTPPLVQDRFNSFMSGNLKSIKLTAD